MLRGVHRHSLWRRLLPVVGGMLYNLNFGCLYTFGNLSVYVASYMRTVGGVDVRYKDMGWLYAISVATLGMTLAFAGKVQKRIGIRCCALLAGCILSAGVALSAWTLYSFPLFTLSYAVMFGLADGLAFSCPLTVVYAWWPQNKGFASGVVLAGTALTAVVFGPLQTFLVNPLNLSPSELLTFANGSKELYYTDRQVLDRLPWMFLCMAALYACLTTSTAFTLAHPPRPRRRDSSTRAPQPADRRDDRARRKRNGLQDRTEKGSHAQDEESREVLLALESGEEDLSEQTEGTDDEGSSGYSDFVESRKMFWAGEQGRDTSSDVVGDRIYCSGQFWLLWVIMLLNGQVVNFMATFWKVVGQTELNIVDSRLANLGHLITAIGNSGGRLFWGWIADKCGFRIALCAVSGLATGLLLLLPSVAILSSPDPFLSVFSLLPSTLSSYCSDGGSVSTSTPYLLSHIMWAGRGADGGGWWRLVGGGEGVFWLWVGLLYFCIGGLFVMLPAVTACTFGQKHFSSNYGAMYTARICSTIITATLMSQTMHTVGTCGMCVICSCCCSAAMVLSTFYAQPPAPLPSPYD
eukprot:GHVS01070166.1.p1 GENE.GHVS01070166.1~~GHVS01070166.1.p1  ORF type:complete len:578 (+),score=54.94 GHVS01070166.1:73-1806(+)